MEHMTIKEGMACETASQRMNVHVKVEKAKKYEMKILIAVLVVMHISVTIISRDGELLV